MNKRFLIYTFIIGVILFGGLAIYLREDNLGNTTIPPELQLKVPKEDILYSQEYTQYEYDEKGEIISQKQIVNYAYKSGEIAPALKDEIIEQRTPHIVYRNLGGDKRSAQSGYSFYKEGNDWKQVKFATTTKEVFDKELISDIFGADTGATSPGTMATDNSNGGTIDWYQPNEAKASDDSRTDAELARVEVSYYLKATNFGFSVSGTIDGIIVEVERKQPSSDSDITDSAIRIIKGGSIGSTDKSDVASWPTNDTYNSYGGATDKWGETWADTDINASTFGCAIAAIQADQLYYSGYAYVDHIRITVYYTEGAPPEPTTPTGGLQIK